MIRILPVFLAFLLTSCNSGQVRVAFDGNTMGTFYQVQYQHPDGILLDAEIDSVLNEVNLLFSTYMEESLISRINRAEEAVYIESPHFLKVLERALEVTGKSDGAFDPVIFPLIKMWGFAGEEAGNVDSTMVDSVLQFSGHQHIRLSGDTLYKSDPRVQLDLNALAKGYGVDQMGILLENNGISDYLVNIAGDVRARGKNPQGEHWRIGIEKPEDDAKVGEQLLDIVSLENRAMATSGDYRNFYYVNGQKYAHIINPATGYPGKSSVLSATMIYEDCMTADAFATAAMAMGLERSLEVLNKPGMPDFYLVFQNDEGKLEVVYSDGIAEWMEK